MKSDFMSYAMVAMIAGLFGWAGYEYAKFGFETWKQHHQPPRAAELLEEDNKVV